MTYAAWEPRHRLTTIRPGKWDVFVLTLIDGKQAGIDPVTHYERALGEAQAFHRDHQCQIKVLPMTGVELRNLLGIALPERPMPVDAEMKQEITDTLMQVASESNDPDARRDAAEMLAYLGELAS